MLANDDIIIDDQSIQGLEMALKGRFVNSSSLKERSMSIVKTVPTFLTEFTAIFPPIRLRIFFEMANPNPEPP